MARASGAELVTRLNELGTRPRLLVLASCESAGGQIGDALAALGPRLAEAGIPAVLAMQGKISMQTVAELMPLFFQELQRDGQVDRALAVARGAVRQQPDHWMPALFMRLKSGRIWYVPGFGDEQNEFEKWASLSGFVREQTCTPILGPGLFENVLGSRREMAIRWAENHGFPLAAQDRDNLPAGGSVCSDSPVSRPTCRLPIGRLCGRECCAVTRPLYRQNCSGPTPGQLLKLQQALKVVAESHSSS